MFANPQSLSPVLLTGLSLLCSTNTSAAPGRPVAVVGVAQPGAVSNVDRIAMPQSVSAAERPPPSQPPFALTSPDGQGLQLRKVEARIALDGPLAWTELWLTFHNSENRVREGRFTITLPPDASMGRFAMRIGSQWMDGEVVEKHAAQVAYEDFLHARQDPAILTKDAGNVFSARVFPIGAAADKELVVAWAQVLADPRAPYVLPLRGLPVVPQLVVRAWQHRLGQTPQPLVAASLQDSRPAQDLYINLPALAADDGGARRDGVVAVGRVTVDQPDSAAPFGELLVLFDTSASAGPTFEQRLRTLGHLVALAAAHGATAIQVVAFDQVRLPVFTGAPALFGAKELAVLRARGALGASDLGAALRTVVGSSAGAKRVVVMSDCMPTMGTTDLADLTAIAALLDKARVQRLDVVLPAGARNDALGRALASAGLPQPGAAIGGDQPPLHRLTRSVLPRVQVAVQGAAWVWPQTVDALQAGDAVVVAAGVPPAQPFVVQFRGGAHGEVMLTAHPGSPALLARLGAAAQVALLESRHAAAPAADKPALAKLRVPRYTGFDRSAR